MTKKRERSTRSKKDARDHYIELGVLEVIEQVRHDAALLDAGAAAIGPFARLDANAVAAREGKTRGVISNLFGSQAAYQAAVFQRVVCWDEWVAMAEIPSPYDFAAADDWLDALLLSQAARGPQHDKEQELVVGGLWAMWSATVAYGLWSDAVARPSTEEFVLWIGRLERVFAIALDRFGLALRDGTKLNDLACSIATLMDGAWLNQALTSQHPCDPGEPSSALLLRAGRLVWRGAMIDEVNRDTPIESRIVKASKRPRKRSGQ